MKKFLIAVLSIAMLLCITSAAFASTQAVDLAKKYVTAIEARDWATAKSITTGSVYALVEYYEFVSANSAAAGTLKAADPVKTFESVVAETATGDIEYVRVIYTTNSGLYRIKYVKTNKVGTTYVVEDERAPGATWSADFYLTGLFANQVENNNAKISVLGVLNLGDYFLIDMQVTNTAATNSNKTIYVFPTIEGESNLVLYDSEGNSYPVDMPAIAPGVVVDKPITAGKTVRTYMLVQNWTAIEELQGYGYSWSISIPVGPMSDVIIDSGISY